MSHFVSINYFNTQELSIGCRIPYEMLGLSVNNALVQIDQDISTTSILPSSLVLVKACIFKVTFPYWHADFIASAVFYSSKQSKTILCLDKILLKSKRK